MDTSSSTTWRDRRRIEFNGADGDGGISPEVVYPLLDWITFAKPDFADINDTRFVAFDEFGVLPAIPELFLASSRNIRLDDSAMTVRKFLKEKEEDIDRRVEELLKHMGLWDRRKETVVKWSRGDPRLLRINPKPASIFGSG